MSDVSTDVCGSNWKSEVFLLCPENIIVLCYITFCIMAMGYTLIDSECVRIQSVMVKDLC